MNRLMILISVILLTVSACKTLDPVKPALNYAPPVDVEVKESYINIPINLDMKTVEKIANEQLPAILYDGVIDNSDKGNIIKAKVQKEGAVSVSTDKGKITFTIGLYITGNMKQDMIIGGISKDFDVHASIKATSLISIDPDWNIKLSTNSEVSITKPIEINILGMKFSFNSVIEGMINKTLTSMAPTIDKEVAKQINLRQEVENAWKKLNDPFLVTNEPVTVWAFLKPSSFNLSPIKSLDNRTLSINIGLRTKIQTKVGAKPEIKPLGSLPKLQATPSESNSFEINLPAVIELQEVNKMLRKEIVGKTYPVGDTKRTVTITGIDFYGAGDQAVILLDIISKKLKGKLYLIGKPVYNDSSQVLEVKDLNFSTETNKSLANSAAWLANKLFIKTIQKNARYDAAKDIEDAKKELEKNLNNLSVSQYFKLNGKVSDLKITNMLFHDNYIIVNILVKGQLEGAVK